MLVDTEWTARESRKLTQRLRHAKLRYPASLEDIDFSTPRGLSREVVLSLGTGGWIRDHHHLLITGPTGIGKSWLASAFVDLDAHCQPTPADGVARGDWRTERRRRHLRSADPSRAHRLTLKGPTMRNPGTRRGPKATA